MTFLMLRLIIIIYVYIIHRIVNINDSSFDLEKLIVPVDPAVLKVYTQSVAIFTLYGVKDS
jgi:hypothetical protein